jgi:hypothetical protein
MKKAGGDIISMVLGVFILAVAIGLFLVISPVLLAGQQHDSVQAVQGTLSGYTDHITLLSILGSEGIAAAINLLEDPAEGKTAGQAVQQRIEQALPGSCWTLYADNRILLQNAQGCTWRDSIASASARFIMLDRKSKTLRLVG